MTFLPFSPLRHSLRGGRGGRGCRLSSLPYSPQALTSLSQDSLYVKLEISILIFLLIRLFYDPQGQETTPSASFSMKVCSRICSLNPLFCYEMTKGKIKFTSEVSCGSYLLNHSNALWNRTTSPTTTTEGGWRFSVLTRSIIS
jgi:hypothetical protein